MSKGLTGIYNIILAFNENMQMDGRERPSEWILRNCLGSYRVSPDSGNGSGDRKTQSNLRDISGVKSLDLVTDCTGSRMCEEREGVKNWL